MIDLEKHQSGPVSIEQAWSADADAMVYWDRDVAPRADLHPETLRFWIRRVPIVSMLPRTARENAFGTAEFVLRWGGQLWACCCADPHNCGYLRTARSRDIATCHCLVWRPRVWATPAGTERERVRGYTRLTDQLGVWVGNYEDGTRFHTNERTNGIRVVTSEDHR